MNHAFPIKHLYKDCGLMKWFLFGGFNKGGHGKDPELTVDDAEGRDGGSPWAFDQTEPIGSVPRSFGQFGHQKPGTDRSLQKTKTEEVRSRLVRFGLSHDRTNRT